MRNSLVNSYIKNCFSNSLFILIVIHIILTYQIQKYYVFIRACPKLEMILSNLKFRMSLNEQTKVCPTSLIVTSLEKKFLFLTTSHMEVTVKDGGIPHVGSAPQTNLLTKTCFFLCLFQVRLSFQISKGLGYGPAGLEQPEKNNHSSLIFLLKD